MTAPNEECYKFDHVRTRLQSDAARREYARVNALIVVANSIQKLLSDRGMKRSELAEGMGKSASRFLILEWLPQSDNKHSR